MDKTRGFMDYGRVPDAYRDPLERVRLGELNAPGGHDRARTVQAARCMDCGTPLPDGHGLPVNNLIPEWNDLVYKGQWRDAIDRLQDQQLPRVHGPRAPRLNRRRARRLAHHHKTWVQHRERAWDEAGSCAS